MKKSGLVNANHLIKKFMPETNFGNETITVGTMYKELRDMGFGNAEAQTIIAALSLAGAQWKPTQKAMAWNESKQTWFEID